MDSLPPDCFGQVLSYLPLRECLHLAPCNRIVLGHVLWDVKRRRHEQFICQHSYRVLDRAGTRVEMRVITNNREKTLTKVVGETKDTFGDQKYPRNEGTSTDSVPDHGEYAFENTHDSPKLTNSLVWRQVPSVKERIEYLYRALPSGHPLENKMKDLVMDLRTECEFPLPSASLSHNVETDETILSKLIRVTKAHRLHSFLLKACVLYPQADSPSPKETTGTSPVRSDYPPLTASSPNNSILLSRYIGDCLTASYLSGHCSFVEGGLNWTKWTCHVFQDITRHDKGSAWMETCYQAWVLLFSMALQHGQFTEEERKVLGLCPKSAYEDADSFFNTSSHSRGVLLQPHYPFMVMSIPGFILNTIQFVLDAAKRFALTNNAPRLRTVFMEFGPLGPAFRGRDNVRSTTSAFHQLLVNVGLLCYQSFFVMSPERFMDPNFFRVHAEWMLNLSRECRKTRPITVMEPYIELSQYVGSHAINEPLVDEATYRFMNPRPFS